MKKPREAGRPKGSPYPVVKSIRFSERDAQRIRALAGKMEMLEADVVRLGVRVLAQREGLE